jgi:hypothetical protein
MVVQIYVHVGKCMSGVLWLAEAEMIRVEVRRRSSGR